MFPLAAHGKWSRIGEVGALQHQTVKIPSSFRSPVITAPFSGHFSPTSEDFFSFGQLVPESHGDPQGLPPAGFFERWSGRSLRHNAPCPPVLFSENADRRRRPWRPSLLLLAVFFTFSSLLSVRPLFTGSLFLPKSSLNRPGNEVFRLVLFLFRLPRARLALLFDRANPAL